jgi:hypothetical protein
MNQNYAMQRDEFCEKSSYSRCKLYSPMVLYNYDRGNKKARGINKERTCAKNFLGGVQCIHMHIIATEYVELMDFIYFEAQITLYLKYGCKNLCVLWTV